MTTPNPQDPYQGQQPQQPYQGQPVDPAAHQPQYQQPQYQQAPQGQPQQPYQDIQAAYPQAQQPAPQQGKSYVLAIVLAFFLGGFGVADFYMGYAKTGIAKIVGALVAGILMALGTGTSTEGITHSPVFYFGQVLSFAIAVWVLVTIFLIALRKGQYATDSKGVPLS